MKLLQVHVSNLATMLFQSNSLEYEILLSHLFLLFRYLRNSTSVGLNKFGGKSCSLNYYKSSMMFRFHHRTTPSNKCPSNKLRVWFRFYRTQLKDSFFALCCRCKQNSDVELVQKDSIFVTTLSFDHLISRFDTNQCRTNLTA